MGSRFQRSSSQARSDFGEISLQQIDKRIVLTCPQIKPGSFYPLHFIELALTIYFPSRYFQVDKVDDCRSGLVRRQSPLALVLCCVLRTFLSSPAVNLLIQFPRVIAVSYISPLI